MCLGDLTQNREWAFAWCRRHPCKYKATCQYAGLWEKVEARGGLLLGTLRLVFSTVSTRFSTLLVYSDEFHQSAASEMLPVGYAKLHCIGVLTSKQSPKSMWRILPESRSNMRLDGCLEPDGCIHTTHKCI